MSRSAYVLQRLVVIADECGTMRVLSISERRVGEVTVLEVSGPLTLPGQSYRLSQQVLLGLRRGGRGFLLDVREVCDCDAIGITSLVVCVVHVRLRHGSVAVFRTPPRVAHLLAEAGLSSIIAPFEDLPAAVSYIRKQCGLPEGDP